MDHLVLNLMTRLAVRSAPDVQGHLPEVSPRTLRDLLIALGMASTVVVQQHVADFAQGRYDLTVESREDGSVWLCLKRRGVPTTTRLNLVNMWRQVMYEGDLQHARAETVTLVRELKDLPLVSEDGTPGVNARLSDVLLQDAPFATLLRALAHLPVLLLDVEAQGRYGSRRSVEREAQRRLSALYGLAEMNVDVIGEARVQA
ncbi:hypothetical protein [Deinococcus enclensis]|uniref:DUF4194 domain-containing protein n=1 Tax=Deinococcus enclensis TaxID=1049582 RepID=A0ABT9MF62_9DEIO|nr:hypothetical protein [Deinococcus enclensis]MDP9765212.1 hypothetical protein [Deinococcus enclensis]